MQYSSLAAVNRAVLAVLQVEVQVVAVRAAGIGAQNGVEFAAGAVMHGVQEAALVGTAPPALLHGDLAAALDRKSTRLNSSHT